MIGAQIILFIAPLVALSNCGGVLDLKLSPHGCLENRAVVSDYTPLGRLFTVGNLTIYEYEHPNNVNKKRMLIHVHDIYGITTNDNLKQVTDQIAIQSGGFLVALPDFFRGDPWAVDRDPSEREEWTARVTDYNKIVKPDLYNLLTYYRSRGIEEFAIFGFCYGAGVSTRAAEELSEHFKVSGIVHPSAVQTEDAYNVKIPMYLMPAKDDIDMAEFYQILQTKFGDNCGHRRFDDMVHGFAGARGNFSDPVIQERVEEVITTLAAFFDRNLSRNKSSKFQPVSFLIMTLITSVFIIPRN